MGACTTRNPYLSERYFKRGLPGLTKDAGRKGTTSGFQERLFQKNLQAFCQDYLRSKHFLFCFLVCNLCCDGRYQCDSHSQLATANNSDTDSSSSSGSSSQQLAVRVSPSRYSHRQLSTNRKVSGIFLRTRTLLITHAAPCSLAPWSHADLIPPGPTAVKPKPTNLQAYPGSLVSGYSMPHRAWVWP